MVPRPVKPAEFRHDSSFVIVGGLGGLGRELCRWMCALNAKHIIVISRSGPKDPKASALAKELREKGVRFMVYACDIGDAQQLEETLTRCKDDMPPIRGIIHCAMDLNVRVTPVQLFIQ